MSYLDSVGGFDRSTDWWRPVMCCGSGRHRHDAELVGIIFERLEGFSVPTMHWSHYQEMYRDEQGRPSVRYFGGVTSVPEESRTEAGAKRPDDEALRAGMGSVNFTCPRGCDHRIPHTRWEALIAEARRVEPAWVDVALYS